MTARTPAHAEGSLKNEQRPRTHRRSPVLASHHLNRLDSTRPHPHRTGSLSSYCYRGGGTGAHQWLRSVVVSPPTTSTTPRGDGAPPSTVTVRHTVHPYSCEHAERSSPRRALYPPSRYSPTPAQTYTLPFSWPLVAFPCVGNCGELVVANYTDTDIMTSDHRFHSRDMAPPSSIQRNSMDLNHAATSAPRWLQSWTESAGRTVRGWTVTKHAVPDKNVASQLLMLRQLLHTKCRAGLRLSRPYQGTPAQVQVHDLPWWEVTQDGKTMRDTGTMVLSYDNLLTRLWQRGYHTYGDSPAVGVAVNDAFSATVVTTASSSTVSTPTTIVAIRPDYHPFVSLLQTKATSTSTSTTDVDSAPSSLTTLFPPVPHPYWVEYWGFQQNDPVTDFRSGGILSLACLVHIVESCPTIYRRYHRGANTGVFGDAAVLPLGITSINVTDTIARQLMLTKSIDQMDTLLSQKPFWNMFADPTAILVVHELGMDLLADAVVELRTERRHLQLLQQTQQQPQANDEGESAISLDAPSRVVGDDGQGLASPPASAHSTTVHDDVVSVFDFAAILATTQTRLEHDLLGIGPQTVSELRLFHARLRLKYKSQLQSRLSQISAQFGNIVRPGSDENRTSNTTSVATENTNTSDSSFAAATASTIAAGNVAAKLAVKTGTVAGHVWNQLSSTASTVTTNVRVASSTGASIISSALPSSTSTMPPSQGIVSNRNTSVNDDIQHPPTLKVDSLDNHEEEFL